MNDKITSSSSTSKKTQLQALKRFSAATKAEQFKQLHEARISALPLKTSSQHQRNIATTIAKNIPPQDLEPNSFGSNPPTLGKPPAPLKAQDLSALSSSTAESSSNKPFFPYLSADKQVHHTNTGVEYMPATSLLKHYPDAKPKKSALKTSNLKPSPDELAAGKATGKKLKWTDHSESHNTQHLKQKHEHINQISKDVGGIENSEEPGKSPVSEVRLFNIKGEKMYNIKGKQIPNDPEEAGNNPTYIERGLLRSVKTGHSYKSHKRGQQKPNLTDRTTGLKKAKKHLKELKDNQKALKKAEIKRHKSVELKSYYPDGEISKQSFSIKDAKKKIIAQEQFIKNILHNAIPEQSESAPPLTDAQRDAKVEEIFSSLTRESQKSSFGPMLTAKEVEAKASKTMHSTTNGNKGITEEQAKRVFTHEAMEKKDFSTIKSWVNSGNTQAMEVLLDVINNTSLAHPDNLSASKIPSTTLMGIASLILSNSAHNKTHAGNWAKAYCQTMAENKNLPIIFSKINILPSDLRGPALNNVLLHGLLLRLSQSHITPQDVQAIKNTLLELPQSIPGIQAPHAELILRVLQSNS